MLEKGRMRIPSTEITSILIRDDIEKSPWRIRSKFSRRNDVITSTWIRLSKLMQFPRISTRISTSNRWQIDEDVYIGLRNSSAPYRAISWEFLKNYKSAILKKPLSIFTLN